jgi:hypothetical protein
MRNNSLKCKRGWKGELKFLKRWLQKLCECRRSRTCYKFNSVHLARQTPKMLYVSLGTLFMTFFLCTGNTVRDSPETAVKSERRLMLKAVDVGYEKLWRLLELADKN